MKLLAESANYLICHDFEQAYLVRKTSGSRTEIGRHYGDPVAALIGPDESWFVTAGEGIVYFDFKQGMRSFFRESNTHGDDQPAPAFVHAIRFEPPAAVRILIDPWSPCASVWSLDVRTLQLVKIQDGPSLADQPYREDVAF
ncbi:hypothetical protein M1B72_11015 [Geomonas paludis]|uniref:Uncharacterized protein n=1 Tax=Geomonas paludis TaxID=2740185 RepID=A0A6V8MSY7_9BACT|nr:hypothetical protein [Geomonas paludis]UPU38213.1 hypothetical protein M1B72_11015 [Geomonas paludis]GFO63255.1 hypothetical protein GMPD_11740 [Geomonas paludis]